MRIARRIAKTVCITLPPDLLKKAQKIAAREHRTMSELFREALRHYMAESSRAESEGLLNRTSGAAEVTGRGSNDRTDEEESRLVHSFRMERRVK